MLAPAALQLLVLRVSGERVPWSLCTWAWSCRLNARECDDGDAFGVVGTDTIICVNEQGRKGSAPPTQFSFHRVYDETATNESIYADSIATCVEDLVAGKNSTILAYGQVRGVCGRTLWC